MLSRFGMVFALCVAAVSLTGCPPGTELPVPPFDATGTYVGTWSGQATTGATKQEIAACPLELTLTQNTAANWPQSFAVTGSVFIDFSCIELPEWAEDQELEPGLVQVTGVMNEPGQLGLLTGGCGTGLCVVLGLDGTGVDADNDGMMDTYAGDWAFSLLLAGVEPLTIRGSFDAEFDDTI